MAEKKKSKQVGQNAAYCKTYRDSGRRYRNKLRRMRRTLKAQPENLRLASRLTDLVNNKGPLHRPDYKWA